MELPLISIIVPIYNAESSIRKCIESIINQTYKNLEIILIDDGSTDSSLRICQEYSANDNRIRLFSVPNGGVSKARNTGIINSNGDYFGFVDSDDLIDPSMYEVLLNNLIETNSDISSCNIFFEFDNKSIIRNSNRGDRVLLDKSELFIAAQSSRFFSGYVWNKLFKKKRVMDFSSSNILFDEKIKQCEDLLFVASYLIESKIGVYCDRPLYHYYQRPIKHNSFIILNKKNLTLLDAYDKLIAIYESNCPILIDIIKYKYIKININYKFRVLKSKDNLSILGDLNNNINKYLRDIYKSKYIRRRQKMNIILSNSFPKQMGNIKALIKVVFKYKIQGR